MINELQKLNDFILTHLDLQLSNVVPDLECEEYAGFNLKINHTNIKFRKSKLTPKKVGQFVTLWKRDRNGKTVPFNANDKFEFYIINIEENDNHGFFFFPKIVLEKHQILSSTMKEGKRGFRLYADWHFPENRQAEKSKQWQTDFFINYSETESVILEKAKKYLSFK